MRANPTVIGAFVVGAIVLGVAGVLLFSGGDYFKERNYFVMFFQDSVDGLTPGSPVKLEGVKIGEVVDVHLEWDPQTVTFRIPVTVEVISGQSQKFGGGQLVLTGKVRERIDKLIAKGLRASLATESFITGQLSIELSFHPETELRLVGGSALKYPEVPTMRSGLSKVMKEVQEIPFKEIFLDVQKTIRDIDARVQSEDVTRLIRSVPDTLEPYRKLGETLDEKAGPLVDTIQGTSAEARETFRHATTAIDSLREDLHNLTAKLDDATAHVSKLVDDVDAEVKPTAEDLRATMESLRNTLEGIDAAAKRVDLLLRDDSPTVTELKRALVAFGDAARSIKALADTLQQQPESLIRGKGD
jgi:paraquat-inducible protein B